MMERSKLENCSGKFSYPDMQSARSAARGIEKRRGGQKTSAYFCPHCAGFHIGRAPTSGAYKAKCRRLVRMGCAHGHGALA